MSGSESFFDKGGSTERRTKVWEEDLDKVPPNTKVIIDDGLKELVAEYDPTWGGGKGAWFNEKGAVVPTKNVFRWRSAE